MNKLTIEHEGRIVSVELDQDAIFVEDWMDAIKGALIACGYQSESFDEYYHSRTKSFDLWNMDGGTCPDCDGKGCRECSIQEDE